MGKRKFKLFFAFLVFLLLIATSLFDHPLLFFNSSLSSAASSSTTIPENNTQEISYNLAKITKPDFPKIKGIAKQAHIRKTRSSSYASQQRNKHQPCANYYAYISIGNKTICLASTDNTNGNLSYAHAYVFNNISYDSYNQFIFGHNSSNIFSQLKHLAIGTIFTLSVQGSTTYYRISSQELVCDYSNPQYPCSNYPNDPVLNMLDAIKPARKNANLAIMTCAGTSIGKGDASHRLMTYAVKL